jgi:diaminopimelate epimerase
MHFLKMHGTGNDFVLVDGLTVPLSDADWSSLSRQMCDRHFGIGSDGLLIVDRSPRADFRMRMFNPDGSESEMCGNGIRCFAKYLYDSNLARAPRLTVETGAGVLSLRVHGDGQRADRVTVSMGVPVFEPALIPVLAPGPVAFDLSVPDVGAEVSVNCVSMGNPHAVMFLDHPVAEFPLESVGPRVERHHLFPRRVNFEVVQRIGPDELDMRVWERGAGLTLACGTGAAAVVATARRRGLIGDRARVNLPGGTLEFIWDGQGEIEMTGPAVLVYEGDWPS